MTYSIVARDATTGELGVAVQSRYFSVGSVVTWAEAGVGAVATQSLARMEYGPEGLELMRAGKSAREALDSLVAADGGSAVRQVAMIDASSNVATHTGERCIAAAGQIVGDGYSVQANMMVDDSIWPAMHDVYVSATGDLTDRLLASLDAAQAAGGDIRGQQSAAVLVVEGKRRTRPWRGVLCDVRVEDHERPLEELRRLVNMQRAYRLSDVAEEAAAAQDMERATDTFLQAMALSPDNDELQFWAGLGLFRQGREPEGEALLRQAFAKNPAMARLVPRLVPLGLVRAEDVGRIAKIADS
jgi:uncharacterized Ntn-hydrolase superfamily protein